MYNTSGMYQRNPFDIYADTRSQQLYTYIIIVINIDSFQFFRAQILDVEVSFSIHLPADSALESIIRSSGRPSHGDRSGESRACTSRAEGVSDLVKNTTCQDGPAAVDIFVG